MVGKQQVKRPDNFSENANILPYGSNASAPAIMLPDTDLFKSERGTNAANYFQGKLDDLNNEYKALKKFKDIEFDVVCCQV